MSTSAPLKRRRSPPATSSPYGRASAAMSANVVSGRTAVK